MTGYHWAKVMDAGSSRHRFKSTTTATAAAPLFPQLRESHRIEDFSSYHHTDSTDASNTDRNTNGHHKNSMASNLVSHFKSSLGFRSTASSSNSDSATGVADYPSNNRSSNAVRECQLTKSERSALTKSERTAQSSSCSSASIPVVRRSGGANANAASMRPKKQASVSTDECSLSDDDGAAESSNHNKNEQLKKVYDMRTWDMYTRITEARKQRSKQQTSSVLIAHARSRPDDAATATTTATTTTTSATTSATAAIATAAIAISQTATSAIHDHELFNDCHNDSGYFLDHQYGDAHHDDDDDDDAASTHSSGHEMVFALED